MKVLSALVGGKQGNQERLIKTPGDERWEKNAGKRGDKISVYGCVYACVGGGGVRSEGCCKDER